MASNPSPTITKRLCHIIRLLYYMLRNSISKRKLMMDLQLLLNRGKLAGKALSDFIAFHHHGRAAYPAATGRSFEFSCSNTPFYTANKKNSRHRRHPRDDEFDIFYAKMIAKASELLNAEASDANSPFVVNEEEVGEEGEVDRKAEDFIRLFYEQLRRQRLESG